MNEKINKSVDLLIEKSIPNCSDHEKEIAREQLMGFLDIASRIIIESGLNNDGKGGRQEGLDF